MEGMHNSLASQSDSITDILSADSFHNVVEKSPSDHVKKIQRHNETSVSQDAQDDRSNEPAEDER